MKKRATFSIRVSQESLTYGPSLMVVRLTRQAESRLVGQMLFQPEFAD